MEHIDARRALELLTDVVDQYGEDVVYEKVPLDNHGMGCRYERNDSPSCLVGHGLAKAGVHLDVLKQLDEMGTPAERIHSLMNDVEPGAAQVFQAAQEVQDRGDSWGKALDKARAKYESIKLKETQQ